MVLRDRTSLAISRGAVTLVMVRTVQESAIWMSMGVKVNGVMAVWNDEITRETG